MKNALDTTNLSATVRTKHAASGLRAISAELGSAACPSTFSRIENGKVPDMEVFLQQRAVSGACRASVEAGAGSLVGYCD